MALEIITAGDCNANVTISRGELIPTYHCIHPIHTLSYSIGLILENIALEITTGGDCELTLRYPMITLRYPVITFDPKWLCTRPVDIIYVNNYLILANMAPEIIKGGESMLTLRYPVRIDPSYTHTRTHKSQNYHVYSAQLELICWKT